MQTLPQAWMRMNTKLHPTSKYAINPLVLEITQYKHFFSLSKSKLIPSLINECDPRW